MPKQFIFSEVWTEIVEIIDAKTLLDASRSLHWYQSMEKLEPGFYLSLRRTDDTSLDQDIDNCHLIGPFEHKSATQLLRTSILYFGATDRRRAVRTRTHRMQVAPIPAISSPDLHMRLLR